MNSQKTANEVQGLSQADYTRLMEAAKRRAHALQREAGREFWDQVTARVAQGLRGRRSAKAGLPRGLEA